MNAHAVLSGLALLIAIGALGVAWSGRPDDDERGPRTASGEPAPAGPGDAALARRVASLERELRELKSALPARVHAVRAGAGGAYGATDADTGGPVPPDDEPPAEVEARIAEVVSEQLEQREEERWAKRSQRWATRQDEQVEALREHAGLSAEVSATLGTMLGAEREQIMALFKSGRDEMRWSEMRQKTDEIRAETDANVKALLDDEQYEAYEAMRAEERGRWGRGRRDDKRDTDNDQQ